VTAGFRGQGTEKRTAHSSRNAPLRLETRQEGFCRVGGRDTDLGFRTD
jgi:hypothetical protein